jgi:hypothetical protein
MLGSVGPKVIYQEQTAWCVDFFTDENTPVMNFVPKYATR